MSDDPSLLDDLHCIMEAHQVYMDVLGCIGSTRHFHGLHPSELRILRFIVEQGEPTVNQVALWVGMSQSHASHVLAQLRLQGWVDVCRDGHDRRRHRCVATGAGKELAAEWRRYLRSQVFDIVTRWPLPTQRAVARIMAQLAGMLRRDGMPRPLPREAIGRDRV